jgi:hypothetical protein
VKTISKLFDSVDYLLLSLKDSREEDEGKQLLGAYASSGAVMLRPIRFRCVILDFV